MSIPGRLRGEVRLLETQRDAAGHHEDGLASVLDRVLRLRGDHDTAGLGLGPRAHNEEVTRRVGGGQRGPEAVGQVGGRGQRGVVAGS